MLNDDKQVLLEDLGEPRDHQIRFPRTDTELDQDEEWCEVLVEGRWRRLRFHDYDRIYKVPGLYEDIFYHTLKCCSPVRVVDLLARVLDEHEGEAGRLRVLDVGAGNGMVGEELRSIGARTIIGVDIIPEAREAALRDRPGVYQDYLIADLCDLPERDEERLRRAKLNALTTVAALGYGDIPPAAFLRAVDLLETPAWLAINIKESFLREEDDTGFCKLIRQMMSDELIQVQAYWRYRHRLGIDGQPLHYVAMAAQKLQDIPDELRDAFA